MSEAIYRKIVDDEGNEELVQVDLNELDPSLIPDEVFYEDGRYKEVADRDYKRRQKLKELEEQLNSQQAPAVDEDEEEETPVMGEQPLTLAQVKELLENGLQETQQQVIQRIRAEEQEKLSREQKLQKLIKDNGLQADAIVVLKDANNPEETAKALSRMTSSFSTGSESGNQPDINNIIGNVNKRLNLD